MAGETGQHGYRRAVTFHEHELKVCDLCSSLNLAANTECIACGWNGYFECSPEVVRTAVLVAIQEHGQLELHNLTDVQMYHEVRPSFSFRVRTWLDRLWKRISG